MKYIYAILIILLSANASPVFAQKLNKPTIDKFTGDTLITSSTEKIFSSSKPACGVSATVKKINNLFILNLDIISVNGVNHYNIPANAKTLIKLSDNKILEIFPNSNSETTDKLFPGGNLRSEISINYLLQTEVISQLISKDVIALRIESSKGNFDYDISDKGTEVIRKALALFKNPEGNK